MRNRVSGQLLSLIQASLSLLGENPNLGRQHHGVAIALDWHLPLPCRCLVRSPLIIFSISSLQNYLKMRRRTLPQGSPCGVIVSD